MVTDCNRDGHQIKVNTYGGNDIITVESLDAEAILSAGEGDDTLSINYKKDQTQTNTNGLYNNEVTLHGEDGGDTYNIGLASVGSSLINVHDQREETLTHTGADRCLLYTSPSPRDT